MEFQARYLAFFLLFSVKGGFGCFWMRSLHKNTQLMLVLMPEFLKAPSLVLLFPAILKWPSWYVICNIAIYAHDTSLYSKCDQTSDLWQQLELAFELESDLRGPVDWGRKWPVDFNAGKTQLVSFDRSNNICAIHVKMDGSVLEENSSFQILGCLSLRNWIGALTLSLLLKRPPRKLKPWFVLWSFFF